MPSKIFTSHLRLGYAGILPIGTLFALIGVLIDLVRFRQQLDRDIGIAFELARRNFGADAAIDMVAIAVMFILLAPIVLGALRALLGGGVLGDNIFVRVLGKRAPWIVAIQIVLVIGLGLLHAVALTLPETAGSQITPNGRPPAFSLLVTPWVTVGAIAALPKIIISIVSAVLLPAIEFMVDGKGNSSLLGRYLAQVQLADLKSDFYPIHGRRAGNFNAAGAAPALKAINRRTRSYLKEYQQAVPGSSAAKKLLEKHWNEVKILIHKIIENEKYERTILFESTSRALDACIAPLGRTQIILSPYEHESEAVVAALLHAASGSTIVNLPRRGEWLEDPSRAVNSIASKIVEALAPNPDMVNVIVISEVCCVTGLRTLASDIRNKIISNSLNLSKDDIIRSSKCLFVLDGAHSVGHLPMQKTWRDFDFFVFSGHKWLLAEHPSGIAVMKATSPSVSLPYDAWDTELPSTIADAGTIAALRASLSWLSESDHANSYLVEKRSRDIQAVFRQAIEGTGMEIVGREQGLASRMLAVRPKGGYKWNPQITNAHTLKNILAQNGVSCEVYDIIADKETPNIWVRVTMSHFHDATEIRRLRDILSNHIIFV